MAPLVFRSSDINIALANQRPTSPLKPHQLTSSQISPPLSALQSFDFDSICPSILPALSYMSRKLLSRCLHITLIVGRGRPYAPASSEGLDLVIIPAVPLSLRDNRIFHKVIERTAKRFPIGRSWFDALSQSQHDIERSDYLVCQSIKQNEVLFSREGLTLLAVDRVHTLKHRLQSLSHGTGPLPYWMFITSCVSLLRQIVLRFDGRPLSKGFVLRSYDHLAFNEHLLLLVGSIYEVEFGEIGIVDDDPALGELSSDRSGSIKKPKGVNGWMPKTKIDRAVISPVTGCEWQHLLRRQNRVGTGPEVGLLPTSSRCEGIMV